MIAAVRGVILAATSSGSTVSVSSTSAKTGTAPEFTTAPTVAMKVNAGTTTSSPHPTPSAASAHRSAAVPLDVAERERAPERLRSRRLELRDLRRCARAVIAEQPALAEHVDDRVDLFVADEVDALAERREPFPHRRPAVDREPVGQHVPKLTSCTQARRFARNKESGMGDTVRYELDGHVATITYNRPDALNAINGEMRRDLNAAFARFRDEEDAWVGIVTGEGDAFCVGRRPARRRQLGRRLSRHVLGEADAELVRERLGDLQAGHRRGERLLPRLRAHARDVVRLRDRERPRASSAFPEVRIGVPTIVGAIRLPQRLNWQYAMELLLTGERIDAQRAKEIGLAGWVVPHDDLMAEARALADRLLQGAPLAQRAIKEMAVRSQQLPLLEAIRFGETMRKVAARHRGRERRDACRGRAPGAGVEGPLRVLDARRRAGRRRAA